MYYGGPGAHHSATGYSSGTYNQQRGGPQGQMAGFNYINPAELGENGQQSMKTRDMVITHGKIDEKSSSKSSPLQKQNLNFNFKSKHSKRDLELMEKIKKKQNISKMRRDLKSSINRYATNNPQATDAGQHGINNDYSLLDKDKLALDNTPMPTSL